MLKSHNKTVFVVSHDKQYWDIADRVLWMENGQMSELKMEEIEKLRNQSKKRTQL